MKRIFINTLSVVIVAIFAIGVSSAIAAKSPKVIYYSNGFPSGYHLNLNIHGKKIDYVCDPTAGGNSIFIPLYSGGDEQNGYDASIEYITNRKSPVNELSVLDRCTGFENVVNDPSQDEPDPAKVQIPYEAKGYYVFGRIHAKPNNGKNCEGETCPSKIILYPNIVKQACNDSGEIGDPAFGDYTDCEGELALGLIVGENQYLPNPEKEVYERFDPDTTKGKGKSKATDITRLFTYVGWVVDERLDFNEDGAITIEDVPLGDYDRIDTTPENHDYNNDGNGDELDVRDWLTWESEQGTPMAWFFSEDENKWILNIADLVITEQGLVNDGTKLLQLRFYPVETTWFKEYVPE